MLNSLLKIIPAIAVSILLASPAQAADTGFERVTKTGTIQCGYFTWPPYILKDANSGKLSGLNYDIMEAIAKNLGLKTEWTLDVGVGDVAAALNANKFDVMCASVWTNPARLKTLTLTNPTLYSVVYAFVRADDARFDNDLSKVNDKTVRISGIDTDYSQDIAKEKFPNAKQVMLPQTASGSETLMQVVSKKADIVFVDQGLVNEFLKTNPGTLRQVKGVEPVRIYGEVLSVRQGDILLKNMLDIAITQLTNDGTIARLVAKYSKENNSTMYAPGKTYTIDTAPGR
ncbi:MAG TPA: transporter substrate-binding domain-containing protein [Alphaproteobacteria bacterium]